MNLSNLLFTVLITAFSVLVSAEEAKPAANKLSLFKVGQVAGAEKIKQLNLDFHTGKLIRTKKATIEMQLLEVKEDDKKALQQDLEKVNKTFKTYDLAMKNKYGFSPGVTYLNISNKAQVYLLLSTQQLDSIGEAKAEDKKDAQGKFVKVPACTLNSTQAIRDFQRNTALGAAWRKRVEELQAKTKLDTKEATELETFKAKLKTYDAKMKKAYGLRPQIQHSIQVMESTIYLAMNSEDLAELGRRQQQRQIQSIKNAAKSAQLKK